MVLRQKDFFKLCPIDIEFGNVGHPTNDYNCAFFCGLDWWLSHWAPQAPGYKRSEFISCYPGAVEHIGRDSSWQGKYDDEYELDVLKWMQNATLYEIIKKYPPRHTYQNHKYWYEKLSEDELKKLTNCNPPIKDTKDLPMSKVMNENIEIDELKKLVKDKLGIDLEGQNLKITRSPLKKNQNEESTSIVQNQKTKEYSFTIDGINLKVYDYELSQTPVSIADEISKDIYGVLKIDFKPEDIVIDLGANVGIFSMYLAKKFPYIKIYSFEPSFANYQHFLKGIEVNNIKNIIVYNLAITKDGRDVISVASDKYSGGAMILEKGDIDVHQEEHYIVNNVGSINLYKIFQDNKIENCKLLKIDIEGFEHEVIPNTTVFKNIDYISGEFHYTGSKDLLDYIKKYFSESAVNIKLEKLNTDRPNNPISTLKKIKEVISGKPDDIKEEIDRLVKDNKKKIIAFNYIWPEYGISFLEESIKAVIPYVYEYHLFINNESYIGTKASDESIKEVKDICFKVNTLGRLVIHNDGPSNAAKIDNIGHYFRRIISLVKDYADYVWMVQSDEIYDKSSVDDVLDICNNDEFEACAIVQPICYFDNPHWFVNPPEKFTRPTIIKVNNPNFSNKKDFDITFHHNSYVLTRKDLRLKFNNWGHRDNVKNNDRFWDIFDTIKTNKNLKDIHPIQPPIYKSVGFVNTQFNRNMFLDWCYYLINHSPYDFYSDYYMNIDNYNLSINHRKLISSIVSDMIPSHGSYLEIGVNNGLNLMLISQVVESLNIIGFEQDKDLYQKIYQNIIKYDLLNNINVFYGLYKHLIPTLKNDSIDCIFINQVDDLKTNIIEVWPKMKNFSIMCGIYDRNNKEVIDQLIDEAIQVDCPWGKTLFRFHEIYKDLLNDIKEYKEIETDSDLAFWFARVRKS